MSDYDLTATGGRFLAAEPCWKCGSSGHLTSYCPRPNDRRPESIACACPPGWQHLPDCVHVTGDTA